MTFIGEILGGVLDLIFPPRLVCPLCGEYQEYKRVCDTCRLELENYRKEPVCIKCGRFFVTDYKIKEGFASGGGRDYCLDCYNEKPLFFMARSAGPYNGRLKRSVSMLKYYGRRDLAEHLSGIMCECLAINPVYKGVGVITPVPLAPGRLRQRGYNQAELLAHGISARMKVPVLPLLRKTRETPPQARLDRSGRLKNLSGAFLVTNAGAVKGKIVLLVDDVITTGVTLNTASEALVRGGARTVLCITAAAGRTIPAAEISLDG